MEIKIDKKFFISIGVIVALCFASFCAGRFLRFRGVSGAGQQLVDGIVLERETADRIANELNIGKSALESADGYGKALLEGVGELRKSSEIGKICVDVIARTIEDDKKFVETVQGDVLGYIDATDYALELAVRRAESYESIVRAYEQARGNSGKDN